MEAGRQLAHYRLIDKIGEGGMGVVWKGLDTTLDREVAIKLLPEIVSADGERLARFEREARLLASLNHPNIATIHGLHSDAAAFSVAVNRVTPAPLAPAAHRRPAEKTTGPSSH